jgi:hypothetical protein
MIKDLAAIVDGLTPKAGRYAPSLTSLFDAQVTAISAVVEPYLARSAYPELRYDRIAATREEMQQEARNIVDRSTRHQGWDCHALQQGACHAPKHGLKQTRMAVAHHQKIGADVSCMGRERVANSAGAQRVHEGRVNSIPGEVAYNGGAILLITLQRLRADVEELDPVRLRKQRQGVAKGPRRRRATVRCHEDGLQACGERLRPSDLSELTCSMMTISKESHHLIELVEASIDAARGVSVSGQLK